MSGALFQYILGSFVLLVKPDMGFICICLDVCKFYIINLIVESWRTFLLLFYVLNTISSYTTYLERSSYVFGC
jgi:hypothetical protein